MRGKVHHPWHPPCQPWETVSSTQQFQDMSFGQQHCGPKAHCRLGLETGVLVGRQDDHAGLELRSEVRLCACGPLRYGRILRSTLLMSSMSGFLHSGEWIDEGSTQSRALHFWEFQ
jgi:hypothetical protein